MAGSSVTHPTADPLATARDALATVTDPELPFLTIADIGILREVRLAGSTIEVVITPTYSGCPAMDVIGVDIAAALAKAGVENYRIVRVLSPAWTTDWLTVEAREKLRANGISPPVRTSGKRALFSTEVIACPKCGSLETVQVAAFGATACKAQWRCQACREPFDYFKCI